MNSITTQLGGLGTAAVTSATHLTVTSASSGVSSAVDIVDDITNPLFASLYDGFVEIETAVPGSGALDTKAWELNAVVTGGVSGSPELTEIIGTVENNVIAESDTLTWDANIVADTTNGRPAIMVTGESGKTIKWSASVRMTQSKHNN